MKVLITGANGFLGFELVEHLSKFNKFQVIATARRNFNLFPENVITQLVGNICNETDWGDALNGVDVIIHTAGRAHILNDNASNSAQEFDRVNVQGTLALARQASTFGVKRFIFISSIGVNGGMTTTDPFTEMSPPKPHAAYASSKYQAEVELTKFCNGIEMELVIIRPPLIYAAHAPGNFARLLKLVSVGIPLPFALVKNKRSFIFLDNLVDFISCTIDHPLAANQTFVISDGEDISTPMLIRALAKGMNKSLPILPIPLFFIKLLAKIIKRESMYQQLCGSLQIDITKANKLLNWKAPVSVNDALSRTARKFVTSSK